ncbi:MAG TPA: hypothetical protein PLU43_12035, partial [Lachnospiraceae bacterium]|nr:hypothetical protein [Lachnospiraceae bacterium]
IRDNTHISCIFPELPDNVCPLFLPVYVRDNRDNFRSHLTENRIYAPVHWPKPAGVDLSDCKGAKYIMENIISIPVDQRYSLADMDRISYIIKSFR